VVVDDNPYSKINADARIANLEFEEYLPVSKQFSINFPEKPQVSGDLAIDGHSFVIDGEFNDYAVILINFSADELPNFTDDQKNQLLDAPKKSAIDNEWIFVEESATIIGKFPAKVFILQKVIDSQIATSKIISVLSDTSVYSVSYIGFGDGINPRIESEFFGSFRILK